MKRRDFWRDFFAGLIGFPVLVGILWLLLVVVSEV